MDGLNNIQQEVELAREQQRMSIPAKRILEKIQGIPSKIRLAGMLIRCCSLASSTSCCMLFKPSILNLF